ncbi:MAG: DUF2125 domain-containing protein [Parvibaculales bacterium]
MTQSISPLDKPPSRRKLFAPYLIGLALLLGYAAFWLYGSYRIEKELTAYKGLRFNALSVKGFPGQWRAEVKSLSLSRQNTILQSEKAYLTRLVYKPKHFIFWAEGEQLFQDSKGNRLTLTGENLRGSLVRQELDNRLSLIAEKPRLILRTANTPRLELTAQNASFHNRTLPEDITQIESLISFTALEGIEELSFPKIDLAITTPRQNSTEKVTINRLFIRLTAPDAQTMTLRGTGQLKLDNAGFLSGKINFQIVNLQSLLGLLEARGVIKEDERDTIYLLASLAAAASGDAQNTLSLPLQFKNGLTFLGPLQIGPAPRLQ